jgi:hypothetical protein
MPFGITIGINEKTLTVASLVVAVLCLLLSFTVPGLGSLRIAATIASVFFAVLNVLIYKVGFIILPLITKILKVSEIRVGGFEIPPSQDVILKNIGGIYYATMFLYARFYESAAVGVEEEQASYMDLWERAVSSVSFPFKFCIITYIENILKFREDVETKRASAQMKLGREREKPRPDPITIDRWERDIARQNEMLVRLSAGEKPLGIVMYVMTSAVGVSADAAIASVRAQANELKANFSNTLNVEITNLVGEDMKKCFEWEVAIPPTPKDLKASI